MNIAIGVGSLRSIRSFDPEKLSVTYQGGVTAAAPVLPRRYTLTHSDGTGELFLTIGTDYAWDKINTMLRDEVLGEWNPSGNALLYYVCLYIDRGEYDQAAAARRNAIFRRELPLALTAIRYGDRQLFDTYPYLDRASVIVHFTSAYPQYARQEIWGTFGAYSNSAV